MGLSAENERLIGDVVTQYVHRLFPSYRSPAYLSCQDNSCAQEMLAAITRAADAKDVDTEVVDLRSNPARLLNGVTERLREFDGKREQCQTEAIRLLVLDGFDLLEGPDNDAPTYPFRSRFQFDEDHLWLFLGQDWRRLRRLFEDYQLPLYHAALDLTPAVWKRAD